MKIIRFIFQFFISIIRMGIVGGLIVFALLGTLDQFLNSDYGVINLIIIMMSFSFFPLFFAILIEIVFYERRKEKGKKQKIKELYTNK